MAETDKSLARWLGGTLAAAVLGLATIVTLQEPANQSQIWLELGKGLVQLVLIGVLGTLLKVVADSHQEGRSRRQQREQFRTEKLGQLVRANNALRKARKLIEANRSVATWDAQMIAVIDAGLDLRVLKHHILESAGAPDPPFPPSSSRELAEHVDAMARYLDWLTEDFSTHKQSLGEEQLTAEGRAPTAERTRSLKRIWDAIHGLPSMTDFLAGLEDLPDVRRPSWTDYLTHYDAALGLMTRLSFSAIAGSYIDIRWKSAASWRRTSQLEAIVAEARRQARQTPHRPADIEALFRNGDDGQRVCALVVAQEFPDVALTAVLQDAIGDSRSAFEQYHALVAARKLVTTIPDVRFRFADFLRTQLAENRHLSEASDRRRLAESILRLAEP